MSTMADEVQVPDSSEMLGGLWGPRALASNPSSAAFDVHHLRQETSL